MTDERLAELERLATAATPGPWEPLTPASGKWVCSLSPGVTDMAWRRNHTNDAAFVAAARTAIPELIAEVRKLREALIGLIGASDPDDLRAMEIMLRSLPVPSSDAVSMINAIHVLLEPPDDPA